MEIDLITDEQTESWLEESKIDEFRDLVDRVLGSRGVKILDKFVIERDALSGILSRHVVGATAGMVRQNLTGFANLSTNMAKRAVAEVKARAKWVEDVAKSIGATKKWAGQFATLIQIAGQSATTRDERQGALQTHQRWNELIAEGGPLNVMGLLRDAEILNGQN
eukprot:TRINITY_DN98797_c0_g1_i1.p1 TRINITY_DN98797_c0_g1~~TRINITY_DN98797_c0_g1_i1.p1  ORF type:complete len:182 (-),score=18.60 TRINITY_DN98797_c0_g1_i1:23-517(-)